MRTHQLIVLLLALTLPVLAGAQIPNPVKWAFTSKKINNKTWEVQITATIQASWRLYAQEPGEGPIPTTFKFTQNDLVTITGKVKESGKLQKGYDRNFSTDLKYYEKQVVFIQTVTLMSPAVTEVKGSVEYMTYNANECLPPRKQEFNIPIGGK
jgi:thiol:disulfide interchange protein DsbD